MGKTALISIMYNEAVFYPIWERHYLQHFDPKDVYIIDHGSTDGALDGSPFNVRRVEVEEHYNNVEMGQLVQDLQRSLFSEYKYVLLAEADELLVLDPEVFGTMTLKDYLEAFNGIGRVVNGYDVIHDPSVENDLDFSEPILKQRRFWRWSESESKPLLSRVPLEWSVGFHRSHNIQLPFERGLVNVHLHRVDKKTALRRHEERARIKWSRLAIENQWGLYAKSVGEEFERWWTHDWYNKEEIPERFKSLL